MANTISNNKISHLINSQVPFFVRNDHETFVAFIEAYYEYLEQNDKVINRIKNIQSYQDVDRTVDDFSDYLYNTFMKLISKDIGVDKALLLKNIKDFYRARGTEKSARFLMRILFDEEIGFYYPKKDVLRVSDGKWHVEKAIHIQNVKIDGEDAPSLADLEKFLSTRITGLKSEAQATIERVDRFFEKGVQIDELILSRIDGDFTQGEQITATFNDTEAEKTITANIISGIVSSITITNAGNLYEVGDPVIILSNTGSGACATVATVTSGNISAMFVEAGGAGYREGDIVIITGGGGSGVSANVANVNMDGTVHPNTYNISNSTISVEANTPLNNAVYSNLKSSDINTAIEDALHWWVYANTGPVEVINVITVGEGYTSRPTLSISANSRIRALGIVGELEIVDGGENYAIGDMIYIENVPGGYGCGALANVWNVNSAASDAISEVRLIEMPGHIIGGSGYDINYLPTCNVVSGTGSNANVIVKSLLGYGSSLIAANTSLGAIQRIVLTSAGSGYAETPIIDLTGSGDGSATATATYITGVFTYPGRYLNDDGHISSYNFLQDRDYYQNFSYVIQTKQSIEKYRTYFKNLIHPTGAKLFGEVQTKDDNFTCNIAREAIKDTSSTIIPATLTWANTNGAFFNPTVYLPSHGLEIGNTITLEFTAGNTHNLISSTYTPNGIYRVANVNNSDVIEIHSGKWLQGSVNTAYGKLPTLEHTATGFQWGLDGNKLFMVGQSTDRIYEFSVTRPWDVTTASYSGKRTNSFASDDTSIDELLFNPDGTIMYVCGVGSQKILQYKLSEAWNAQTASLSVSSLNFLSEYSENGLTAFTFSANGDFLYVLGTGQDTIWQFALSENWNVNTTSYLTEQKITTISGNPRSIVLNNSGNTAFVWDLSQAKLFSFSLANNWNINAASYMANSVSPHLGYSFGGSTYQIQFRPDGKMLYLIDNNSTRETLAQVPLTEAWNANTIQVHTTSTENVLVGRMI